MLTGKRFRLTERILGIEVLNGERKAVSIPLGAVIEADSSSGDGNQTMGVLWGDKQLEIFACDLKMRGAEMIGPQPQVVNRSTTLKKGAVGCSA